VGCSTNSKQKRRLPIVKDWYRHGSGEVPDIILRVAEEVRKALSNQKVVEVLVPLTEDLILPHWNNRRRWSTLSYDVSNNQPWRDE
jgi:hypothetical protein